ncbi:hypothetical protein ScPMuIL_003081 [Solemya velum]
MFGRQSLLILWLAFYFGPISSADVSSETRKLHAEMLSKLIERDIGVLNQQNMDPRFLSQFMLLESDTNHSGTLDEREIANFFREQARMPYRTARLLGRNMVSNGDENNDGELTIEELTDVLEIFQILK